MTSRLHSLRGLRLLGLAFVLMLSILAVRPGQAFVVCNPNLAVTYYSDASHTTVVGHCGAPCCGTCQCTGTITAYSTSERVYCPDQICPS
jgi:hypothetical protein